MGQRVPDCLRMRFTLLLSIFLAITLLLSILNHLSSILWRQKMTQGLSRRQNVCNPRVVRALMIMTTTWVIGGELQSSEKSSCFMHSGNNQIFWFEISLIRINIDFL